MSSPKAIPSYDRKRRAARERLREVKRTRQQIVVVARDGLQQDLRVAAVPVVPTVKGKATTIVQDAEAYQRLLDIAARADAEEGICLNRRRFSPDFLRQKVGPD